MTELITGLIGLLGVLLGGFITYYLEKRLEAKREFEAVSFRVYMMLLDLYGRHQSIVTAEFHNELAPIERRRGYDRMRWLISDELRKAELPELEEIMLALHGDFRTESQRAEALNVVTDKLGTRINQKYVDVARKLGEMNESSMLNDPEFFKRRMRTRMFS